MMMAQHTICLLSAFTFQQHSRMKGLFIAITLWVTFSCLIPTSSAQKQHDTCKTDAQCLNGGHCELAVSIKSETNFNHCICHKGFGGQRCESFCPLSCENGGICHKKDSASSETEAAVDPRHPFSSAYACKCLGHWSGTVCDVPYENCRNGRQCFNGGTCREDSKEDGEGTNRYCDCPPNFGGPSCQEEREEEDSDTKLRFTDMEISFMSLAIALAIPASIAVTVYLCKKRKGASYKSVEVNDYELAVSSGSQHKDERWRNIV